MARELARAEKILRRAGALQAFHAGINLGRAAGAGVDGHLHAHLVPAVPEAEWSGPGAPDGERPPVPVEETYGRLAPLFDSGAGRADG